jgi:hypothetical protein
VALIGGALALAYLDRHLVGASLTGWNLSNISGQVVNVAVPVAGFILASRRPGNRIGWLFLLFPTGSMRSRRWRPAAWFVGGVFTIAVGWALIAAANLWARPFTTPAQVAGLTALSYRMTAFLISAALLVSVAALVSVLQSLAFLSLWTAIAVAVLKYRLYEIDRIISRTLAYAIVTSLLVGVYTGLVLLATQVFRAHTPVAVAASTLAAAALFNPLRRRVQQVVDRRFNRARYDADQTVAAFAAGLKDTVNLHSVRDDLATVVDQALEPVHVSVWISHQG